MRYLIALMIFLSPAAPAMAVELSRYRGVAREGWHAWVRLRDERAARVNYHQQRQVAEIAADLTTFYHVQIGALETQELRQQPLPFWLLCFSDTIKDGCGSCISSFFCRMERFVEPSVSKRM